MYAPDVSAMRWVLQASAYQTQLRQEAEAVCENPLISGHQFTQHLKHSGPIQNSERLLQMLVDEKDETGKITSRGESTVLVDR